MTTLTRRSAFRLRQAAGAAKMLIARWRMFAVRPGRALFRRRGSNAHRVLAMSNVPKAFSALDHKPGVRKLVFKFVKRMTTALKGSVAMDSVAPRMGVVVGAIFANPV